MNASKNLPMGNKMMEASFSEDVIIFLKLIMTPNKKLKSSELAKSAERIVRSFDKLSEMNNLSAVLMDENPATPHGFPEGSHVVATYKLSGKRTSINLIRIDRLLTTFFDAFPCFNYQIIPTNSAFLSEIK